MNANEHLEDIIEKSGLCDVLDEHSSEYFSAGWFEKTYTERYPKITNFAKLILENKDTLEQLLGDK